MAMHTRPADEGGAKGSNRAKGTNGLTRTTRVPSATGPAPAKVESIVAARHRRSNAGPAVAGGGDLASLHPGAMMSGLRGEAAATATSFMAQPPRASPVTDPRQASSGSAANPIDNAGPAAAAAAFFAAGGAIPAGAPLMLPSQASGSTGAPSAVVAAAAWRWGGRADDAIIDGVQTFVQTTIAAQDAPQVPLPGGI